MDKYDEAIAFLNAHPDEILLAWHTSQTGEPGHPAHCLFQYVNETGQLSEDRHCFCLTQIKSAYFHRRVITPLTMSESENNIVHDARIPVYSDRITLENLSVFAEWQRKLDVEFGRK